MSLADKPDVALLNDLLFELAAAYNKPDLELFVRVVVKADDPDGRFFHIFIPDTNEPDLAIWSRFKSLQAMIETARKTWLEKSDKG